MTPLRLFIAADMSAEQQAAAEGLIEALKKGIAFTSAHPAWVRPEGLHLTLKFLGNVESARVKEICQAVQNRIVNARSFEFSMKGLGVFPNEHRPQVLWIGARRGETEMKALQAAVEAALEPLGFARESRPFHPHLTLARIKSMRGAQAMMDVVQSHRQADLGAAETKHLTLYQSHLNPDGARYEVLHRWPLMERPSLDVNKPQER
jgi:2'-5' RNA ligase